MTRKRFIKLAMAEAYEELYHTISGRFGFYMLKYKKKLAKRRKS